MIACYCIMPSTTTAPRKTNKAKTKAPSKAAASKAKTKPKAAPKAVKPAVVTAPPSVPDPAAPEAIPAVDAVAAAFAASHERFQQLSAAVSAARAECRALEKLALRELRAAHKANARRKKKQGARAPSGFVKPTPISDKLAKFLGKDAGTEMARTEVTRELNAYIREHNLQDKDNGRKINADSQLRDLLQLSEGDELTYFNLQKYMSPHFAKAKQSVSAAS